MLFPLGNEDDEIRKRIVYEQRRFQYKWLMNRSRWQPDPAFSYHEGLCLSAWIYSQRVFMWRFLVGTQRVYGVQVSRC